jgi:hypothetical protein
MSRRDVHPFKGREGCVGHKGIKGKVVPGGVVYFVYCQPNNQVCKSEFVIL